jgi:hypothetical protein
MWPVVFPRLRTSLPARRWAARQSGSRGTLSRIARSATRSISASASPGRSRCSSTSSAQTQSNDRSPNGRSYAEAASNDNRALSRRRHSAWSAGSPRSTPTVDTPVRAASRSETTPSPHPTSRMPVGEIAWTAVSTSSRKRASSLRVIGFRLSYFSVALPMGPMKSEGSGAPSDVLVMSCCRRPATLSGEPPGPAALSALARPCAPRAVT